MTAKQKGPLLRHSGWRVATRLYRLNDCPFEVHSDFGMRLWHAWRRSDTEGPDRQRRGER
jgi:hypothetical protein